MSNGAILRLLSILIVAMAGAISDARAETVVKIIDNGTAAAHVDMVILGDGYKASQMTKFHTDAQKFIDSFFAETPFKEYKKSFNVSRIDTPSTKSGANHSQSGVPGSTVYGAYFWCFQIDRLLCVVDSKVDAVLSRNNMVGTKADMVIVIVNDNTYGGSGGKYAVTSTEASAGQIAIHEFGHSFGHLDDEYAYDDGTCGRYNNPWGFNVTKTKTRASIPWTHWIAATTKVPTAFSFSIPQDKPGLYEGAYFCLKGWYRPTPNSKMQTLGTPFYKINTEQLIRRIYTFTDVITSTAPKAGSVTIPKAGSQKFTVKPRNSALQTLKYTWRVNGVLQKSTTSTITISGKSFGATTKLDLTVQDKTPMVKKDTAHALINHVTWTLKRGP